MAIDPPTFTCARCGYTTQVKANYKRHLARTEPCLTLASSSGEGHPSPDAEELERARAAAEERRKEAARVRRRGYYARDREKILLAARQRTEERMRQRLANPPPLGHKPGRPRNEDIAARAAAKAAAGAAAPTAVAPGAQLPADSGASP